MSLNLVIAKIHSKFGHVDKAIAIVKRALEKSPNVLAFSFVVAVSLSR